MEGGPGLAPELPDGAEQLVVEPIAVGEAEAMGGDGLAHDDPHRAGSDQPGVDAHDVVGAGEGHRHEGHPGVQRHDDRALLEAAEVAIGGAGALGEDEGVQPAADGSRPGPDALAGLGGVVTLQADEAGQAEDGAQHADVEELALGHGAQEALQQGHQHGAVVVALVVGGTLGVFAALRQNRPADYTVMAAATLGVTIPNFVVAPVLTLILGVWLGWLPVGGWNGGAFVNVILPVVTLALPQIAVVARLTRGSMIEALRSNHVRTARAYGLTDYMVVVVHALRGALLPVVSYLGPAAAALLTGSVVVETIFGIPGIGRYFVQGALNRDYTLVMGTVVVIASFVILFNLLVDLLYALLDPRVRYD